MGRRERRRFTDEVKTDVVGLARSSGKSIPELSRTTARPRARRGAECRGQSRREVGRAASARLRVRSWARCGAGCGYGKRSGQSSRRQPFSSPRRPVCRYRFIEVERVNHAVTTFCRVLLVSRAAYYQGHRQPQSEWSRADVGLATQIATIHAQRQQTYGAPRVQAELRIMGEFHSRTGVARLMRQAGLAGR